ncbi:MAG: hypothetical protein WAV52_01110 [Luteococcus japonicus]
METNHPVDELDLDRLTQEPTGELRITVTMPTERSGRDTRAGATRLRNLAREAERLLVEEHGQDQEQASTATRSLHDLADDHDFWQHQADSLVVLLSGEEISTVRLATDLPEQVNIGTEWNIRPLAAALDESESVHLLAFSRNRVRLFVTDGTRIKELALGPIPASEGDIYRDRDHQEHLQFSAQGGGDINHHGHGADPQADRVQLERFLRHVARGLEERIRAEERLPLVLACVESNAPLMREILSWPTVLDEVVSGSPDHLEAQALADATAPVLEEWHRTQQGRVVDEVEESRSRGRVLTDLGEVTEAAEQGRIQTLFVSPTGPAETSADHIRQAAVNHALVCTLRASGEVRRMPAALDHDFLALTRY